MTEKGDDLFSQQGGAATDDQPESVCPAGGKQIAEKLEGSLQIMLTQIHREERNYVRYGCFSKDFCWEKRLGTGGSGGVWK